MLHACRGIYFFAKRPFGGFKMQITQNALRKRPAVLVHIAPFESGCDEHSTTELGALPRLGDAILIHSGHRPMRKRREGHKIKLPTLPSS